VLHGSTGGATGTGYGLLYFDSQVQCIERASESRLGVLERNMAFNPNFKMALRDFRILCSRTDQTRFGRHVQCVNCRMPVSCEIEHHRSPTAVHSFT
jgi:hypothetical protein